MLHFGTASGAVAMGSLLIALQCLTTTAAYANGRIPGATGLAIHPTDERQLLLGLSFGLALTRDGGASWTWMCEQQIQGNGSDVDPSIVVTGDGSLVVLSLTNGGVLVSRNDGCTFERALGPLQGNRGADLTLDPSQPGRVLGLMSTITDVDAASHAIYRNFLAHSLDNGQSWEQLSELPNDLAAEAVEIAPSDPKRIYISGTSSANALQGIVERSDDGGLTWTRTTVELPRGSGSLFISGIHPSDPDRLWFRVPGRGDIFGVDAARLWLSTDGALSFQPLLQTAAGMLGFALSPDGSQIAFGGPRDGLLVAPADASAAPVKVADLRVSCLRWNPSGLYVCAGEPVDPYSLGFAPDPTQRIIPLWQRANTCREACSAPSTLEQTCRAPWEMIAPLVGATSAVCEEHPALPAIGTDAGSGVSPERDAGASKVAAAPAAASGCTATPSPCRGAPRWLVAALLIFGLRRARFRSRRRERAGQRVIASNLSAIAAALLFVACACGDPAAANSDEHLADHEDDDFMGCPPGIPSFAPGLHAAGKLFSVKLLSALPEAPERYSNNWTVELDLLDGSPAAGAKIKQSQTFMPVHGHDGRVMPEVSALAAPGQFQVDRVTFTMRGPWEVRFWLDATDGDDDYVVLQVCVEK